jgi:hypothetical protein
MKRNSAKQFWEWFTKFSTVYIWLPASKDKADFVFWIGEINKNLKMYGGGSLTAIFEWEEDKGTARLIVTANGRSDLFFKVDQLIKQAPSLPDWQFQALIPPRIPDHSIVDRFSNLGIEVDALWFRFADSGHSGQGKNIEVYAEVYNPWIDQYRQLVEAIVFNLLGERTMTNCIREVEIKWLYAFPPLHRACLQKLVELPALLLPQKEVQNIDQTTSMTSLKNVG